MTATAWDPTKHPRHPAGTEQGGEFAERQFIRDVREAQQADIQGFPPGQFTPDDTVKFWPEKIGEYSGYNPRLEGPFWKALLDLHTGEEKAFWFVDRDGFPHHAQMRAALDLPGNRIYNQASGYGDTVLNYARGVFTEEIAAQAEDAAYAAVRRHRRDIRDAEAMVEGTRERALAASGALNLESEALVKAFARLQRQYEKVYRRAARRAAETYRALNEVVRAAATPDEVVKALALVESYRRLTGVARRALLRDVLEALDLLQEAREEEGGEGEEGGLSAIELYLDLLQQQTGVQAERLVAGAQDAAANVMLDSLAQGWSVPQTADALRAKLESIAPWQATMLARTDLVALANGASLRRQVLLADPQSAYKTWLATPDERTRIDHRHAHGQTVPIQQPFTVAGEQLLYPGDPSASDAQTINCRCSLVYSDSPFGPPGIQQIVMKGDLAVSAAAWDETKHPRHPRGSEQGGEFASKGTPTVSSPKLFPIRDVEDHPWAVNPRERIPVVYVPKNDTMYVGPGGAHHVMMSPLVAQLAGLSGNDEEDLLWGRDAYRITLVQREGTDMPRGVHFEWPEEWTSELDKVMEKAAAAWPTLTVYDPAGEPLRAAAWDESKHLRHPKGGEKGGEFRVKEAGPIGGAESLAETSRAIQRREESVVAQLDALPEGAIITVEGGKGYGSFTGRWRKQTIVGQTFLINVDDPSKGKGAGEFLGIPYEVESPTVPEVPGSTLDEVLQNMGAKRNYYEEGRVVLQDEQGIAHFKKKPYVHAPEEGTREPVEFGFRAVSEEDWQNALKRGYLKSDGRMNLVATEGTVASLEDPTFYLPGKLASDEPGTYEGRIVKLRINEKWRLDSDGYLKTNEAIPLSEIAQASPLLRGERRREVRPSGVEIDLMPEFKPVTAAAWDPSEHPRHPAGTPQGGEFAPKANAATGAEVDWEPARAEFETWAAGLAPYYTEAEGYPPGYWEEEKERAWQTYRDAVGPQLAELQARLNGAQVPGLRIQPELNPQFGGDMDAVLDPDQPYAPDFQVELPGDPDGFTPSFTVWTYPDEAAQVEDVLDITDTDFFPDGPDSELAGAYARAVDAARGVPDEPGFVTIYRGMSDAEYGAWQAGEEIPLGKFFAGIPTVQYAQDISGEPPQLYTFRVPRSMLMQTGPNEYQLKKRGRMNRPGELEPSEPVQAAALPSHWQAVVDAISAAVWNEADHPRDPGGEGGGQFISKSGTSSFRQEAEARQAAKRRELAEAYAEPGKRPPGFPPGEWDAAGKVKFWPERVGSHEQWGPFWKAITDRDGNELAFWFAAQNGNPHHEQLESALGLDPNAEYRKLSGYGMVGYAGAYGVKWDAELAVAKRHRRDIRDANAMLPATFQDPALAAAAVGYTGSGGMIALYPEPDQAEAMAAAAGWDESKHPRHPAGSEKGGEFMPLYHGTNVALKPGEIVMTAKELGYNRPGELPAYYDPAVVYMSTGDHLAERYAVAKAGKEGGEPHVYEVEPVGEVLTDPEAESGFGTDQRIAPAARVVREVKLPGLVHWSEEGFMKRGPKPVTAAAVGYTGSGGMVCLYPTKEEAQAIARRNGQPAEDLHVTLLYYEDGVPGDAEDVIRELGFEGLKGEITGIARFQEGEDGVPVVGIVSSVGLNELRAKLAEALPGYSERFGFVPHMTLGYEKEGDSVEDPEDAVGQAVTFRAVSVKNGHSERQEVVTAAAWSEEEHPRWPAGDERGGQFRPKETSAVEQALIGPLPGGGYRIPATGALRRYLLEQEVGWEDLTRDWPELDADQKRRLQDLIEREYEEGILKNAPANVRREARWIMKEFGQPEFGARRRKGVIPEAPPAEAAAAGTTSVLEKVQIGGGRNEGNMLEAVRAVDEIMNYPVVPGEPKLKMRGVQASRRRDAGFARTALGLEPVSILVAANAGNPISSVVHEMGHYLDSLLGQDDWAPELAGRREQLKQERATLERARWGGTDPVTGRKYPEIRAGIDRLQEGYGRRSWNDFSSAQPGGTLQPVLAALKETDMYRGLERAVAEGELEWLPGRLEFEYGGTSFFAPPSHIRYLMRPHEMIARSFEQYVATKNPASKLAKTRRHVLSREPLSVGGFPPEFPGYTRGADLERVSQAWEQVLDRRGLLKKRGIPDPAEALLALEPAEGAEGLEPLPA